LPGFELRSGGGCFLATPSIFETEPMALNHFGGESLFIYANTFGDDASLYGDKPVFERGVSSEPNSAMQVWVSGVKCASLKWLSESLLVCFTQGFEPRSDAETAEIKIQRSSLSHTVMRQITGPPDKISSLLATSSCLDTVSDSNKCCKTPTINLTWSSPRQFGSKIEHFELTARSATAKKPFLVQAEDVQALPAFGSAGSWSSAIVRISDWRLEDLHNYNITVQARSKQGIGRLSVSVPFTTPNICCLTVSETHVAQLQSDGSWACACGPGSRVGPGNTECVACDVGTFSDSVGRSVGVDSEAEGKK
jgi:hypothetical protein